MARPLDVKTIKSAKRVLEVLEFFDSSRREATVMDIAREYGYPQSSTSELLSCLVELGFLHRDRYRRTYRPTAKVAVLGGWANPVLFRRGGLLGVMDELASEHRCSVVLAGVVALNAEHLEFVDCGTELPAAEQEGPVTTTTMGKLLLSVNDRFHIRKLVHRINSEADESRRVRCEALLIELDQICKLGAAVSPGVSLGQGGIVSILLPVDPTEEALAIGIVVAKGDMRGPAFFINALRDAVEANFHSEKRVAGGRACELRPVPAMAQVG